LAHDEEAEAQSHGLTLDAAAGPVEALEDLAKLTARNADAAIRNLHSDAALRTRRHGHPHLHRRVRILDRVLEQVAEHQAEFLLVSAHPRGTGKLEVERALGQAMAGADLVDARLQDPAELHGPQTRRAYPRLGAGRGQDLIEGSLESAEILPHGGQKVATALRRELVTPEGLHEEAQRGEWCLHLVGDRVQEVLLALIEAHLPHQPDADQQQPEDEQPEEEGPQDQQQPVGRGEPPGHGAQIGHHQDLPAHREGHGDPDQDDAEREGKPDRATRHAASFRARG
jgi:hypothetical protein